MVRKDQETRAQLQRRKIKAKDIVNRTNQQPTDWGKKIFTNPTSNRGLISKIFKELKKLTSKNPK